MSRNLIPVNKPTNTVQH